MFYMSLSDEKFFDWALIQLDLHLILSVLTLSTVFWNYEL